MDDDILMTERVEQIAEVAHEANRAYCRTIGDLSQLPWSEAPEWQKDSTRAGVRAKLEFPALTPEEQHRLWMDRKLADGWRYGPTKDVNEKIHPCLVDYAELSLEQRLKDYLFGSIVLAFIVTRASRAQLVALKGLVTHG